MGGRGGLGNSDSVCLRARVAHARCGRWPRAMSRLDGICKLRPRLSIESITTRHVAPTCQGCRKVYEEVHLGTLWCRIRDNCAVQGLRFRFQGLV